MHTCTCTRKQTHTYIHTHTQICEQGPIEDWVDSYGDGCSYWDDEASMAADDLSCEDVYMRVCVGVLCVGV